MFLSLHALKLLQSIERIQPRMAIPCTTIVCCLSYTNTSDETDTITVCNEQSSLVRHVLKHDVLIIGEDMNTHIG